VTSSPVTSQSSGAPTSGTSQPVATHTSGAGGSGSSSGEGEHEHEGGGDD
jgi:hypothetical protein